MLTYENSYRDKDQLSTLTQLKEIVNTLNIDVKLTWINFNPDLHLYSCTLSSSVIPQVFAIGKSHNALQAECSAYGELIEKLCAGYIIHREPNVITFKDEFMGPDNKAYSRLVDIHDQFIEVVKNETFVTNDLGRAAGGTYEEAEALTICELLESFLLYQFCCNNLHVNGRITSYNLNNEALVNHLQHTVGQVFLYDISINYIPSVLLIVLNQQECDIRIGVAQSINAAIEKTLLRLCSKIDILKQPKFKNCKIINSNNVSPRFIYYGLKLYSSTLIPKSILQSVLKNIKSYSLPQKEFNSNKEFRDFLLKNVQSLIGHIYFKDIGFLGFPVVKAYADKYQEPIARYTIEEKQQTAELILSTYKDILIQEVDEKIGKLFQNAITDVYQKLLRNRWRFDAVRSGEFLNRSLQYNSHYHNF